MNSGAPDSAAKRASVLAATAVERQRAGALAEAARLYEQVLQLVPAGAGVLSNLGDTYRRLERCDEALGVLRRALQQHPSFVPAHYNLGLTLDQLGRPREAADAFERVLELQPTLADAALRLLSALRATGQLERALACYARFEPGLRESWQLQAAAGNVLADLFRVDEAVQHFLRALELAPDVPRLHADLAAALVERGEIAEALEAQRRALALAPDDVRLHSSLLFLLELAPQVEPTELLAEARGFDARHTLSLRGAARDDATGLDGERRLRVGYFSPDFRQHATEHFITELLRHHDRTRVEVFAYSAVATPDAGTARLRALSDHWRDIARLDDDAAAELIGRDSIDVLVDLAMHTGQGRPLLFARRPAPIQACWLAYPGTTGLSAMDYRLTDALIDPPGTDGDYSEQSLRLDDGFWCYTPPSSEPSVSELPALRNGYVTFGSQNSFKKVNDAALELWARVLEAVPSSRMLLVAPAGEAFTHAAKVFERRGVAAARLERLPYAPRPQYLANYGRIDCCLDTLPYCGGTTSLDAAWMGVPVVSLRGRTAAGRGGSSIAHFLGLPELSAPTREDYVVGATQLTSDLQRLSQLRQELRPRMRQSALMDAPRFARSMERAFRKMVDARRDAKART
jgi:predicted O-linked N-acetylglucosamine transferase (SPINDLY family)